MLNYAKGKPMGNNQIPFYESPPAVIPIAVTVRESAATSSILILNTNTTAVEVTATNTPVRIKWLTQAVVDSSVAGTSVLTTNFDGIVPAGASKHFVIPVAGSATHDGAQVGANVANNLYTHMATIGAGATASITAIQF